VKIIVTFKLAAESRGELIDSFAGKVREFQEYVDRLVKDGILPAEIRFLVVSGRWEGQE